MVRFELPWDLVEEILSRVPATSLTRLRFTCKRWNALFKDQKYITNHMGKAMKQNFILVLSNFRVYSLSKNLQDIYNNIAFHPLTAQLSPQVEITNVFHCNGLLLCSTKECNKTKLVVVNPCNGQARWIEEPRSHYTKQDRYILGYENNNNESYDSYKILRVSYDRTTVLEIFELKSNSWRVLADVPPELHLYMYGKGESLKGNTHWLSHLRWSILSFDFTTETFRHQLLPFPYENSGFNTIALSIVREDQIAVVRSNTLDMRQMEIWVMNMTDTEMVLSYTFDFRFMLNLRLNHASFFIEEDTKNLIVVGCGRSEKNMIYIVGKHGYRKLDYEQSNDCAPFFFRYVPSLVSLNYLAM